MAEDNLYSLLIKVEGGDAAAAEIIKSKYALRDVKKESDSLSDSFSKPVEHIGLHTLSMELARASGLGGDARGIFMALNAVIGTLGAETAAVLGPMALTIGIAAIAYEKFHKSAAQATQELKDSIETNETTTKSLDDYANAGGHLSDALKAEAAATKEATAEAFKKLSVDLALKKAKDEAAVAANKDIAYVSSVNGEIVNATKTTEEYTSRVNKLTKAVTDDVALQEAYAHGFTTIDDYAKSSTKSVEIATDANQKMADVLEDLSKKQTKSKDEFNDWSAAQQKETANIEESANAHGKKIDELSLKYDNLRQSAQDAYDAEIKKIPDNLNYADSQGEMVAAKQILSARNVAIANAEAAEKSKAAWQEETKALVEEAKKMQSAFNSAISQVIMKQETMKEASIQLRQQIEQDAIQGALKFVEQEAIKRAAIALTTAANETSNGAAVASTTAQTAAVGSLAVALAAATKAATALDVALAAAA